MTEDGFLYPEQAEAVLKFLDIYIERYIIGF